MDTQIKTMSLSQYLDYVEDSITDSPDTKIVEGKATTRESLEALLEEMKHPTYNRRLGRYLERNNREIRAFESLYHKQQFMALLNKKNCLDYRYLAALYLLTADERVWRDVRDAVTKNNIHFEKVTSIPSKDGYEIYQVAKDLAEDTSHINLADIASSSTTKPSVFVVISKALAICRYGVGAVGIKPISPQDEEVVIFKLIK